MKDLPMIQIDKLDGKTLYDKLVILLENKETEVYEEYYGVEMWPCLTIKTVSGFTIKLCYEKNNNVFGSITKGISKFHINVHIPYEDSYLVKLIQLIKDTVRQIKVEDLQRFLNSI